MVNGNLPDVVQFVLCESAAYDLSSDSWVLVRPYFRLRLPAAEIFPVELERSALYFQLIDAFGAIKLSVEVRNTKREGLLGYLYRTETYSIELPKDRSMIEDVIHLPSMNFLEEAEYEFRLLADGRPLGSRSVVCLNVRKEQ